MTGEPSISRTAPINMQAVQQMQQAVEEENVMVVESQDFAGDADFSGMVRIVGQFKELDKLKTPTKLDEKAAASGKKILDPAEAALRHQQGNDELNARTLMSLRSAITDGDDPDEIAAKVMRTYPDYSLADEAMDFLLETTEGRVKNTIKIAKDRFNQEFKREIAAGRNMGIQSREFAKEGLGSPTALRDMYRDITGNPREALKLFEELTEKFRYDKLKTVITFLLHSLGADLKSKGASIPHGELKRLIDETRSLQGILGIFRFFQSRMKLIQRQFAYYELIYPPRLNFEVLGRIFAKILAERYINPDKILQVFQALGLSEEAAAQLIICTQFRDALKQVAPKYYRNPQHRDELFKTILAALEKLEDEMEEEEEEK